MSQQHEAPAAEPIAVIGLACRVPGAGDARRFWQNLVDGVDAVRVTTLEEQRALGVPEQLLRDPNFVPAAMVLDDHDGFDTAYFGMSTREAEVRDPQHRLFLEVAHTALEDAGYDAFRGPMDAGVYAGVGSDVYQWLNIRSNPRAYATAGWLAVMVGNHADYCATLTSYKLDLRGPSVTLHTACSTSLVAVHTACEALRNGECDVALAGGANIEVPAGQGYVYDDDGITSPDGHCRAFDAAGGGTIWGSGAGVVVLKRLSDAIADRDHVRAVVRGNAVNNDGAGKVGFSAPSLEGQAAAVAQALGVAEVDPRTVTYVEAHGTGTALGDPIEVGALSRVFQRDTDDSGWCAIGSVKSNIGHLGQSAGIAGMIKTVLALEHGVLPASLHYETPNPKIDFGANPFYVNAARSPWPRGESPRRAGVSSFGIGGTNAHLVLEEAPPPAPADAPAAPVHLLQVSARTETALDAAVDRLADHLERNPDLPTADVAHTLRAGRRILRHRAAVVAVGTTDAAAGLRDPRRLLRGTAGRGAPRVALLFSGQGAQYAGMGAELHRTQPVFRAAVDECAELLGGILGEDLRDLVLGPRDPQGLADEALRQTARTQPALFMIEYALAQLWRSWGVEPSGMLGHSIGEYVAATVAGVFDLPGALRLVAGRSRLMQGLPPGSMLAVQSEAATVHALLPDGLTIATVNGPGTCVVAGPTALVDGFAAQLSARDVAATPLRTSHAFHSPMVDPILAEFAELVAAAGPSAPTLPFVSNVTGTWITADEATSPSYWARHLRETVRFGDGVATLLADDGVLLLECGPGRQLCGLARVQVPRGAVPPLPSLPGPQESATDLQVIQRAAGTLWTRGVALDDAIGAPGARVPLPTYPWERRRMWIDPEPGAATVEVAQVPGRDERAALPVDRWFAVPGWRQLPPRLAAAGGIDHCLVLAGDAADGLVAALRSAGTAVTRVRPGAAFARGADGTYTVRPAEVADHESVLADLAGGDGVPARLIHALALEGAPAGADRAALWAAQDQGFFSLLALVQALAATQPAGRLTLDVLTAGTQGVTGGDLRRPEHATVQGIARVVPLEAGWLGVRHIDLDERDLAGGAWVAPALAELRSAPEGDGTGLSRPVALRAGRRWAQEFEAVEVAAQDGPAAGLREGGVYLVTGGLGGLGLTLAERLAGRARARLALVSRRGLPPREQWDALPAGVGDARTARAIAAVRRMEAAGAEVAVLAADVADAGALRTVRDEVLGRFGRLDGIVHAAGLAGGGMAEVKDRAVAEAVLAPKLLGTLALREVFGDLDLDVVLLCSSVTAVTGGFGQVDYCGANAFLDAWAAADAGWAAQVVSVDWGGWLEVGMAAEADPPAAFRARRRGGQVDLIDHPLLTERHRDGDGDPGWCRGTVSAADHWVLDEHRMSPVPLMPGTGYVEAARCAAEALLDRGADGQVVELRDLAFVEPLPVPDGTAAEVRVVATAEAGGIDLEVRSVAGDTVRTHARGSAGWVSPGPAPVTDLAAVQARCTRADGRGGVPLSSLLTYGPHWHNLRRWWVGDGEALALLEAEGIVLADLDRWVLHPGMLDEATSFARLNVGGHYLPLGYGRLVVRGQLPARMWSHLRFRDSGTAEVITADVSLLDDGGREVVAITDYVLRRIDPDAVLATVSAPPATAPAPAGREGDGILPEDGAEAFQRLLATGLAPQVAVTARPLAELAVEARGLTGETVAADLGAAATARAVRGGEGYVAPRTELEAAIVRLWGEVLGGDEVGVEDDFFELGGNSLVAVQLIALMRKQLGVRLPMRSLFEEPTVAGVARLVEQLRDEPGRPAAPPDAASIPRQPRRTT